MNWLDDISPTGLEDLEELAQEQSDERHETPPPSVQRSAATVPEPNHHPYHPPPLRNVERADVRDDDSAYDLYAGRSVIGAREHRADNVSVAGTQAPARGLEDWDNQSESDGASLHHEKPEDWRRFDHPSPEYVQALLLPLFTGNPLIHPSPEESRLRIIRAYHQQDWGNRGYLTRSETETLCSSVLMDADMRMSKADLKQAVRMLDSNQDAMYDQEEFVALFNALALDVADRRKSQLQSKLLSLCKSRIEQLSSEANSVLSFIPWGWYQESDHTFYDTINHTIQLEQYQAALTFTAMSNLADDCVRIMDEFENKWLPITPQSEKAQYSSPLKRVRDNTLRFTIFEHPDKSSVNQRSDLDDLLVCYNLASSLFNDPLLAKISQLREHRKTCFEQLEYIHGFCTQLRTSDFSTITASAHNYPQFRKIWSKLYLSALADLALETTVTWAEVEETVKFLRTTAWPGDMEALAAQAAEDFDALQKDIVKLPSPWTGVLKKIEFRTAAQSSSLSRLTGKTNSFQKPIL
jgi:hypothetical protein